LNLASPLGVHPPRPPPLPPPPWPVSYDPQAQRGGQINQGVRSAKAKYEYVLAAIASDETRPGARAGLPCGNFDILICQFSRYSSLYVDPCHPAHAV